MELDAYQLEAARTSLREATCDRDVTIPLLGLAGEVGELQSEYKKALRDGGSFHLYRDRFAEELGDILWYVGNLATTMGFSLEQIAVQNLAKARERWGARVGVRDASRSFDEGFPDGERLPRRFDVSVRVFPNKAGREVAQTFVRDVPLGDHLNDNSYVQDGYRYHDTFHFAFAAVLGWSPITRWLLGRKRKSLRVVDEVEDGARAKAAEEAISLFIFSHAREYNWLEGTASVSSEMLRSIKRMCDGLEVQECTSGEWEDAIIQGFRAWRFVQQNKGGVLSMDLDRRLITASPLANR